MSETIERLASALAGRYRIERELGAGGMATVYLAEDVKHGRMVAVKVLKPELAVAIGAERFLTEIKTTANLQHPHILALHDSGEVNGTVYYVMPFVEGESLRDRLDREKQLPVDDALRIAGEVADALQYAHERGVIHRDIKPENILLQRGHAVVADFGIALAASRSGGTRMTETGMSLGTPTYMSPEQAMGSREVDARTDVYSLGCVLYEMLIGEPPFVGPTAQSIVAKVVTELPKSITAQRHTVPAHVDAAVQVALEKLAADRFASAGAFAEALRSPGANVRVPGAAGRARPRATGMIATALLVAAAVAGAFLLGRRVARERDAMITAQPRTYRAQAIYNARYSANAESFVFSGAVSGNSPSIYLVSSAFPEPRKISDSATHLLAVSSKDELAVLVNARYLHHRVFSGTLARMPMGGGAAREVAIDVHDAAWSPDGTQLAIAHEVGGRDRIEYPVGTVLYETSGYVSELRIAPDGQRIAFNEHPEGVDDRGFVAVIDLQRKHEVLTPQYSTLEGLAWRPDGKTLVFSGAVGGSLSQVDEVTLGGVIHRRTPGVGSAIIEDVGRDGRELVVREDAFSRMWLKRADEASARDVSWLDRTFFPIFAGDGSFFVFGDASNVAGASYATMLRRTDGAGAVRLGEGAPLAVSANRQWVLSSVPSEPVKLVLYPVGAGTARRLDHGEFVSITGAAFAANGVDIVVCGNEKAMAPKCYAGSVNGGSFRPFTSASGRSVAFTPDGSAIVVATDSGIRRISVRDGALSSVAGGKPSDEVLRFSPDGNFLWVRNPNALPVQVEAIRLATGARTPLIPPFAMPAPSLNAVRYMGLADDPRTYAWVQREVASYIFELTPVK